jgi:hypothetical protein
MGLACFAQRLLPDGYRPRDPQKTLLYRIVRDHLKTFLRDAAERDAESRPLPRHVVKAFNDFLGCGILTRGFARLQCAKCRYDLVVPFS